MKHFMDEIPKDFLFEDEFTDIISYTDQPYNGKSATWRWNILSSNVGPPFIL